MRTLFSVFIGVFFGILGFMAFVIGDPHGGQWDNSFLMSVRYFLEQKHLLGISFFSGIIFLFIAFFSIPLTVGWGIKLFRPKCSECGQRTRYVGSKMDSVDFDTIFYRCNNCGNISGCL